MRATRRSFLFLALAALAASPAAAQIRASELGSMSQVIDGTTLTVTYSRPRARERSPIFGSMLAHWGEVWTPGANWATTLETTRDITINQRAVPKGKYSVWMVLKEQGDWTLVLDPDFKRFHTEPPDSTPKQVRLPIHVDQAPFMDVLTWSMPELSISGGTLAMQWGTTRKHDGRGEADDDVHDAAGGGRAVPRALGVRVEERRQAAADVGHLHVRERHPQGAL